MIKKWMWSIPATFLFVGGIAGATVGGYISNQHANPYREYMSAPIGNSNSDMIQSYFASIENGSKLLMLPSYTHTSSLTQALDISKQSNEPLFERMNQAGFILLDDAYGMPIFDSQNKLDNSVSQPLWTSQVASVKFRTDLGSFLTGIAVGEFLNEYQYYFAPNQNDKLTWATYGGATYSSVTGYMGGLQRGIRWFNENIVPYAKNQDNLAYKPIEQVFINSELSGNFTNGFGLTDGNQLINLFLDKNVSLLIPVAGPQTQQAVRLIKQRNKKTIVLGVDSAMENDTNTNLDLPILGSKEINGSLAIGGTNKIIQFSSMKKLDSASKQIIEMINKGQSLPESNKTIGGFGYQSLGTTQNGSVGVSETGYSYFIKAIHIFEKQHLNSQKIVDINIDFNDSKQVLVEYERCVELLENQPFFNELNKPENKVYYTDPNWFSKTEVSANYSWKYTDLPNSGTPMMPLIKEQLGDWVNYVYSSESKLTQNQRLQALNDWFSKNEQTINIRHSFNLTNQLNESNYHNNHSLIKVIVNTPDTPLLDKGFCQTAYMGLVEYWRSKNVFLPLP